MEINIFELVHLLIRKLWVLILSAIVCAGLAFCYSFFSLTPLYTSTSTLYINNSQVSGYENKISSSDISAAESLVNNVVAIIKSRSVAHLVYLDIDRKYSEKQLSNIVSASVVNNTVIVQIDVECEDPTDAQKINASFVKNSKTQIEKIIEKSGVETVDEPSLPSSQSYPDNKTFIILGLLAGLVISSVAVVIIDILDTKIDSEQDFAETFPDIPIIGIIPNIEEL
ncbi:MAG: hypothetical protein IJO19_03275 [Clostridia bacterium]|nr:hypothetical protein [Clostridia bacterium]